MKKNNSRRDFLKKSAVIAMGTIAATKGGQKTLATTEFFESKAILMEEGKFTLPALPYAYDALEPHIDKMTMEVHHDKHHQTYVTNLNKAMETVDSKMIGGALTLENIFAKIDKLPVAVRNNGGGHYNHSLYWTSMKPKGGAEPKGKLGDAIKTTFISYDEFKKQFSDVAMKRFASGWAWLVVNNGKLAIGSTANQDNPLMNLDSVEIKGTPLLVLDVWEHAYYLKNQNRRADYIASWWNVVNWETAENLFAAAK